MIVNIKIADDNSQYPLSTEINGSIQGIVNVIKECFLLVIEHEEVVLSAQGLNNRLSSVLHVNMGLVFCPCINKHADCEIYIISYEDRAKWSMIAMDMIQKHSPIIVYDSDRCEDGAGDQ